MRSFNCAVSLCLLFAVSRVQGALNAEAPSSASALPVHVEAGNATAGILAKRVALMKQGTADLALGNTAAATAAFESAVSMAHAPDAELGLVRGAMQAGQFRQALSISAHTAGAHQEEPEGAALYVLLLHLSGQDAAARRILRGALARRPDDALLLQVQRSIEPDMATLTAKPGAASTFAPYSLPPLKSATATMSGSGVLIDGGRHALVPLASVVHARKIWLRNGLGQLRKAVIKHRVGMDGMALLALDQALPLFDGFNIAAKDPFPGSVVYSAEYPTMHDALPQWPLLLHGFLGTPVVKGQNWELGLTLPGGSSGGPVFDASGSLAGIAVPKPHGKPMFLPVSRFKRVLGDRLGPVAPPLGGPRIAVEIAYEKAMRAAVQVLTVR